jgi:pimeloyl-ACP methyl ester carboxylesterase
MKTSISSPATARNGIKSSSSLARRLVLAVIGVILFLGLVYSAICVYAAMQLATASRLTVTTSPADAGLTYQDVQFPSAVDSIPLSGWYVGAGGIQVILVLHARGGVRDDDTIGFNEITPALVRAGYDVLAFDFRGHGSSGGQMPGFGKAEQRDVAGAIAYLKSRGVTQVGALGCSMGGDAALLDLPNQPEIRALVADSALADAAPAIESGFTRQTGMPSFLLPGILFAAGQMYGLDWSNTRPVDAIALSGDRPILLIHGGQDSWTPISGMYQLQKAGANNPNLQTWVVPEAEHCRSYMQRPTEYLQHVLAFFSRYLK